jgi:hypothetical protein
MKKYGRTYHLPSSPGATRNDKVMADLSCLHSDKQEGFVVRATSAFRESDMPAHMGKYVRTAHVQSEEHWMQAAIVRNGLP